MGRGKYCGGLCQETPCIPPGCPGILGFTRSYIERPTVPKPKLDRPPWMSGLGVLWKVSCGRTLTVSLTPMTPRGVGGFLMVWEGIWLLGGVLWRFLGHLKPSWGGVGASWRHVVSHIGQCWAILSDLGGHLGLSEAFLEPHWAIMDALTSCGPPIQVTSWCHSGVRRKSIGAIKSMRRRPPHSTR